MWGIELENRLKCNRKSRIFWKVFIVNIVMLLMIVIIAYLLLYYLLPSFYKNYKIKEFRQLSSELIGQIKDGQKETEALLAFSERYDVDIILKDEQDDIIFDYYRSNTIVTNIDQDKDMPEISVDPEQEKNKPAELSTSYELNNEVRTLFIIIPLEPIDEAKEVVIQIYPYACLVCFIFAFILSIGFTNMVVKPIKIISKATKNMSKLEADAYIQIDSSDEIGELSSDINGLYSELKATIDSLNQEINKYSSEENKKINFLRTISHELKNPLASANSLLEGVIYEIPPYTDEPKKYLLESKELIEKAISLTKESLKFSTYKDKEEAEDFYLCGIVEEILSQYRVIIESKQIKCNVDIDGEYCIRERKNIFSKALSNIISNAVNYTSKNGRINIYLRNNCLSVENTCVPLRNEQLEKIFEPFYSVNNDNKMSTGLGLYIVNQLLNILHIRYRFVPFDNGMRFIIELNSKQE